MNFKARGFTLLNALFAFSVYIVITVYLVGFFVSLTQENQEILHKHQSYGYEVLEIDFGEDFRTCIEKVLP